MRSFKHLGSSAKPATHSSPSASLKAPSNKLKAAVREKSFFLIDMDETAIHTEAYYFGKMADALSSVARKDIHTPFYELLNGEEFKQIRGISGSSTLKWFAERLSIDLSAFEEIYDAYREGVVSGFSAWISEGGEDHFVDGFLEFIKAYSTPFAIVTTTREVLLNQFLEFLPRQPLFSITGEDVKNRKPHPEPYLLAVEKAKSFFPHLSLADFVAFEDSLPGRDSAKAADIELVVNVSSCLWKPCIKTWRELL